MSSNENVSYKEDYQENVIEISELIKVALELTGVIQRRFRIHRYHRQAQLVGDIRGLLAEIFEMDLIPDDTFAKFIAGAFESESEDEI